MEANKIVCLVVLLLLASLPHGAGAGKDQPRRIPQRVSLVQLLATPEKYDHKFVAVRGYYHGEFESSGLSLTKEHATYSLLESAIWIGAIAPNADTNRIERVNDAFIQAEGIFYHIPVGGGHSGMGTGELNEITLFVKLPERTSSQNKKVQTGN